jgi:hypothetical protein
MGITKQEFIETLDELIEVEELICDGLSMQCGRIEVARKNLYMRT